MTAATQRAKPVKSPPPGPALSRRHFLQASALAAGGIVLGFPQLLRARESGQKLSVGVIGLGAEGLSRLRELTRCDVNIAALCDVDENQTAKALEILPSETPKPKIFSDYRQLLDSDVDAVVIVTPDHWHAPIARAALKAEKHAFCEKPLTHTVAEARELRLLSAQLPRLATQMGNQGSASPFMRRAIELIQAGVIGQVREVHVWVPPSKSFVPGQSRPSGHDPVPSGLDWDRWIGPAPFHEYLEEKYHPRAWRAWYDFGGGSIGDWGCHGLNLPFRALKLDYPTRITPDVPGGYTYGYPKNVRICFEFPARKELPPVKIWWYDGGRRPLKNVIPKSVIEHFAEIPPDGVLMLGDKGFTYGAPHPGASYIQLAGEKKLSGILNHQASQNIPRSLPKSPGHVQEWIAACAGGPPTFSNFETGGRLTEIVQAGVVAIRAQQTLEWNGEAMTAANAPTAAKYIRTEYRSGWQ